MVAVVWCKSLRWVLPPEPGPHVCPARRSDGIFAARYSPTRGGGVRDDVEAAPVRRAAARLRARPGGRVAPGRRRVRPAEAGAGRLRFDRQLRGRRLLL